MSTRARATRQQASASRATPSATDPKSPTDDTAMKVDDDDSKQNIHTKVKPVNGRAPAAKKSKGKKIKGQQLDSVDCICSKGDDGSPMILCSMCKIWYHFTCVDITEPLAGEINVYICPTCTQTTRRRSAMHWEGEQAIEECSDDDDTAVVQRRKVVRKTWSAQPRNGHADGKRVEVHKFEGDESDEADDSADDYVDENELPKRMRPRRLSVRMSDSDGDPDSADDNVTKKRRVRRLQSPSRSPGLHGGKRKAQRSSASHGVSPAPPSKRKRSGTAPENSAHDDPVRKYCLSKLEEMFKEIYFRYPYVRLKDEDEEDDDGGGGGESHDVGAKTIKKELADMSDEEKDALLEDSKRFTRELETCVYELYAEPDKSGNPHAGAKYKDRFRTLQFNLSKPDRVVIHQRIISGALSAKEISVMSSTDLADEETKQSIRLAEKEALEHSILQKQMVPRAKITHKGLQDIEDVRGDIASADFELEKERQEEEKREREKLARRASMQATRQRTASMSIPPESPVSVVGVVVPASATSVVDGHQERWGAPPPLPFHAMVVASPSEETPARGSLFTQTAGADFMSEPELNLDDIIHMDEDQDGYRAKAIVEGESTATTAPAAVVNTAVAGSPSPLTTTTTEMAPRTPSLSISTTGISPFAQRQQQDTPRARTFDLNALWSEQRAPQQVQPAAVASDAQPAAVGSSVEGDNSDKVLPMETRDDSENMELESVEANDQDFDMFLADDVVAEPPPPPPPPSVEVLPQVWAGKITMPLDSSMPQETTLVAHQIGGKPLAAESPLWKTLFPAETLRIEGRVAVESSVNYLVQMRLNPSKELYAVAFVPSGPQDENHFKALSNFLISKNRHGLIFPWGMRPRDYYPGRELYIIPLLHTDTLPEFVELLDDLKLPKVRSKDYLIGVWILNKGKLAPPLPSQPSHPPPVVQPQAPPGMLLNQHQHQQAGSAPLMPQLPNPDMASLTPEIQHLLRTLASSAQVPPMVHPQLAHPPFPLHPLPQQQQPWAAQPAPPPPPPPPGPPFPFNFPHPPNPNAVPFQQPQAPLHNSPSSPGTAAGRYDHAQASDRKEYDRSGYERDYRTGGLQEHHHGERSHRGGGGGGGEGRGGWRGQLSRGRGRGRGRGDGQQDRDFRSQRDSGWPRRQRGDGQDSF